MVDGGSEDGDVIDGGSEDGRVVCCGWARGAEFTFEQHALIGGHPLFGGQPGSHAYFW